MQDRTDGLTIVNSIDNTKVNEGMKSLKRNLGVVNSELKANMSAFDKSEKSMQKYRTRIDGLNQKMKIQKQMFNQAEQELKTLNVNYEKAKQTVGKVEQAYKKLAEATRKEKTELDKSNNAVKASNTELKKAQDQQKRTNTQKERAYEKLRKLRQAEKDLKNSNQATTAQLKKASEATKTQSQKHSELVAKYKQEGEQVKKLRTENKTLASSNDKIKASYNKTNTELKQTEKEYNKLNATIKNHDQNLAKAKNAVNNERTSMNNLQKTIDKTKNEMKAFNKEQLIANSQYTKAANHLDKMSDRFTSIGHGMSSFGRSMSMYVTTPIVGAMGYASKLGVEFDDGMRKVQAISGATGKDLDALKAKAREMGATTKFSASDSAEALNYMAMAGWKSQDMIKGLPGIMNLAAASGEELGLVSDIVTDGLTAFGLQAKDSGHFADVLASASANANTNVQMMGDGFKYAAPVAGALGYTIEDTSIAIGLMSNAGIKGEKAGTALRTMFTNLAKPTKAMKNKMEELGISITDSNGKMKPMRDVLGDLREKFSGLTKDQQAAAAATIFGKESMSGALAVINASEKDYNKLSKAIDGSEGSAKKMSKTMEKGLGGSLRELRSAAEELALSIFDTIQPALSGMVSGLKGTVDFLNKLPSGVKVAVAGVLGLTAAIGPLTLGIGLLLRAVGGAAKGYAMLNRQMAVNTAEAAVNAGANNAAAASMATTGKTAKTQQGLFGRFGNTLSMVTGRFGGLGKIAKTSIKMLGKVGLPLTILTTAFSAAYEKLGWFKQGFSDLGRLWNQTIDSMDFSWIGKIGDGFGKAWDSIKTFGAKALEITPQFQALKFGFDKMHDAVSKASDTTDVFSGKVSKGTKKALESYTNLSEKAKTKLEEIRISHVTIGNKQYDQVKELYGNINTEVNKQLKKRHSSEIKGLEKIFNDTSGLSKSQEAKILEQTKQSNKKESEQAEKVNKQILDIYAKAHKEKRSLTKSENDKVAKLQEQLDETVVKSLSKGEVEQKAILERMKQNKGKLSMQAASNVIKESAKERDKTISDAKKKYKSTVAEAVRQRDETGNLSKSQADKVIKDAKKQYEESKTKAKKQHKSVVSEAQKQNKGVKKNIDSQTGHVKSKWEIMKDSSIGGAKRIAKGVSGWFASTKKSTDKFWNKIGSKIGSASNKGYKGAKKWLGKLPGSVSSWFKKTKKNTDSFWNKIGNKIVSSSKKGYNGAKKWFSQLPGRVSGWFKKTKKNTDSFWNKIGSKISSSSKTGLNGAKKWLGQLPGKTSGWFKQVKKNTDSQWNKISKKIGSTTQSSFKSAKKWFGQTTKNARNNFSNTYKSAKDKFDKVASKAENKTHAVAKSAGKWFGRTFKSTKDNLGKMWSKAKDIFGKIAGEGENKAKKTHGSWKSWLDKTLGWIKNITGAFGKAASELGKSVANKAVDGLNGMIGGINKISKAITSKTLIKPIPHLSTGTYDGSALATNNDGGLKNSTLAVVNDKGPGNAPGGGTQEIIERADGSVYAPKGRNVVVPLSIGDRVHSAKDTKRYQTMGMLPRFSKGSKKKKDDIFSTLSDTIKDVKGGVKEGVSETAHGIKKSTEKSVEKISNLKDKGVTWLGDAIGDVMDWIEKPGKLVNKVFDSLGISFGSGKHATVAMAKGAFSKLKASFIDKVKEMFDEVGGGEGDAGWLLKHDIWQRFGPYTGGLGFNGGQHYGIDFGMTPGTNVKAVAGGKVSKVWNDYGGGKSIEIDLGKGLTNWYMHLSKQLVKQGQRVGVGDLIAKSGNTGHFTAGSGHLHFQLNKNGKPQSNVLEWLKGLGSSKGGKGESYARSVIKQAQNILGGKYKGSHILNNMMKLAKRESNYDSKAVNNWDSNAKAGTPSKGLFQMIQPTFLANAKKGFSNFGNPVHQAISAMQYIQRKYGWGGFPRAAAYAYENGGMVTKHQIAEIGEGNKPEMVVPLTKRTRAIQLIEQAMRYVGMETGSTNVTVNNDNSTIEKMLSQLVRVNDQNNKLTQTIIKLLSNQKQGSPKDAANIISQILGEDMRMASFNQGG